MGRLGRSLLVALLACQVLARASPPAQRVAPGEPLPATRKLVELTARRLGQLRQQATDGREEKGEEGDGLTCEACKVVVDTLDTMFMENRTWDDIVAVITEVCIELKIEDRNVCTLVVREFKVALSLSYKHASAASACLGKCRSVKLTPFSLQPRLKEHKLVLVQSYNVHATNHSSKNYGRLRSIV